MANYDTSSQVQDTRSLTFIRVLSIHYPLVPYTIELIDANNINQIVFEKN